MTPNRLKQSKIHALFQFNLFHAHEQNTKYITHIFVCLLFYIYIGFTDEYNTPIIIFNLPDTYAILYLYFDM